MQKASGHHLPIYFFLCHSYKMTKHPDHWCSCLINSVAFKGNSESNYFGKGNFIVLKLMVIGQNSYPYSLLILATDIAAFNLHPDWQDTKPQLKPVPLLSNQQQMTRTQGSPLTYCNKLLTLPRVSEQLSTQHTCRCSMRGSIKCRRKELILQM